MMQELLKSEFFAVHREKIIKGAVIGLIVLAAVIVFAFHTGSKEPVELTEQPAVNAAEEETGETERLEESAAIVVVDVAGAVLSPSVVHLKEGARVEDAIAAAGGLAEDADVSQINRAAVLHDGEKLYIPAVGEDVTVVPPVPAADGTGEDGAMLVNINTATTEELESLKGVGPVTAAKIIEYRTVYGAFETIEDIKNVDGIGEKTFEGLKDQITV
ncbi:MAG: helix-hairpin-helix domain-containing protein [Clostridiales bacterium]|nr:helix-hairpin-helix domain-containing protein [Clostridiales bacterium]